MAELVLSSQDYFANSPFGVMLKERRRRRAGGRALIIRPPPNTQANRRTYDLLMQHLFGLCRQNKVTPSTDPATVSERVFGRPLVPSRAWNELLVSFETDQAALVAAEEPIRLSIAFARGRLYAMQKEERTAFVRVQESASAAARSRQYEAEKRANGGEIDFFTSGAWKRLRFEVLAESAGCCDLCGRSYRSHGVALEVDHIKPRSRFPSLSLEKDNLQVLCFDCNRGKGNRDTTDWRATPANDAPQDEVA